MSIATLEELRARRTALQAAGRTVQAAAVGQQIIAQETLARLRAEEQEHRGRGDETAAAALLPQLRFWARQAGQPDPGPAAPPAEPVEEPVDGPAGEPPAAAVRARAGRQGG